MKHVPTAGDRFRKLIATDFMAGFHSKKKRRADGGSVSSHIAEQAKVVNVAPSEAQKKAGNYRKGHIKVHGLDITIENPKGSTRSGKSPDGRTWQSRLPHHYGYVRRTEGGDGDHVDVFVGPHLKAPTVYVIDQHHPETGEWDEHKCMIGFGSRTQAEEAYKAAFSDKKGQRRIGHVEAMPIEKFRDWLRGDTTTAVRRRAAGGGVMDAPPPYEPSDGPPPYEAPPYEPPDEEPADHGLSERQKLSPVQKALNPLTSYWDTYKKMNKEGRDQMARGTSQLGNGAWETTKGVGNIAMGGLSYVGSPINAGYRSVVGQPLEDTTGIPREYTEFAGQLATPGLGFTRMLKAPGAVAEVPSRVVPRGPEADRAAELGDEFGIKYSRGQSEGDLDRIRYEDMAQRGAYGKPVQDKAAQFFDQQYADTQAAGRDVGAGFAPDGVPPAANQSEAAGTLTGQIADKVQQAKSIVQKVVSQSDAEATAQRGVVADSGRTLDDVVRGQAPQVQNPREMGEVVSQNVRDAAQANRQERSGLYGEVAKLPGEFRVDAVRGIGTRVRNEISSGDNPIVIDDQLTPAASRAIQALDEMSVPRIQNRADPRAAPDPTEIAGVSLRGIDQMRKKLIAYYQAAKANPTDARAVQGIIHGFDAQIERAITEGLFSGDPRALEALQQARASHARYRQTFGPQGAGDDVGTAMRRIVERNATPEETANMIIGSGKIGSSGTPVRLADRLEQVLGADSDGWSAVRQAIWQRASQVRNPAGVVDPAKSAASIVDFAGSSLARRMFSPEELAAMRSHARGVQDLERTISEAPSTKLAERAQQMYGDAFGGEGIGGQPQAVFRRIVDGTATPEEVSGVVFNAIGGGNPGHVSRMIGAIERVVGKDSPAMGAIRQGIWQRATLNAEGRSGMGMQRVVNNISELLHGKGASVSKALYTPEQIALMDRYAEALRKTIIPKNARTNSDTAVAAIHAVRKYGSMITSGLGFLTHGGLSGGLEGYAVGKLIDKGVQKVAGAREAKKISDSLDNIMPKDRARVRINTPSRGVLPATSAGRAPQLPYLGGLQGTMPAGADDKQQQP